MSKSTEELLKEIKAVCRKAQQGRLNQEDLQSNMEDGWGGNGDDAFYGGMSEGKADLAAQLQKLLECRIREPMVFKTAIPYHIDECPGCVHVHHQKGQYNLIFKCNECGDQRKLTLDPDDGMSFPIGLTSPANNVEIKE
jgi:hypothetical protein